MTANLAREARTIAQALAGKPMPTVNGQHLSDLLTRLAAALDGAPAAPDTDGESFFTRWERVIKYGATSAPAAPDTAGLVERATQAELAMRALHVTVHNPDGPPPIKHHPRICDEVADLIRDLLAALRTAAPKGDGR